MRFSSFILFIEAMVLCLFLTPLVRAIGIRFGVIDQPDQYRKLHKKPVARCGGISVFLSFLIPICLFIFFVQKDSILNPDDYYRVWIIVIGGATSVLMGLADDIWDLRARWKLVFQFLIATIAYSGDLRIDSLSNPFGGTIFLGPFGFPVTVFWFMLCMNAINLFDGLDGLAAGISLFVSLTLLAVSMILRNDIGIFVSLCLSGAVLGFLVFNFNPASIFLGDSGSMFLGFSIAALSVISSAKTETVTALFVPAITLLLPFFDLASAALRRWSKYLPITMPDGKHLHHRIMSYGFSARRTVVILYGACILLCAGAILLLISSRSTTNSLILIGIALMFIFGNQVFKVFDVTEVKERISHDHKLHSWSKQMTIKTAKATTSAGMQKDFDAAWDQISTLFPEFELNQVSIIDQKDTPKVIKAWKPEEISHKIHQKGKPTPLWSVKFPVKTKDPNLKYVMEVAGSGSILRMKTVLPLLETLKSSLDDLK
jgi:UDP-GlcNAc:undecaprenyl-phosphate GlcNAc-1-phosphate transferase